MTRETRAPGSKARLPRLARFATVAAALVGAAAAASPADAAVVYDEGVSGDLSNSGLTPTSIPFALGSNIVQGTTGHDQAGAIDRDYWTFTVGPNQVLSAIIVQPGTDAFGFSFIGMQTGSQVTLPVMPANASGLLGWYHYTDADVGTDILDNMSVAANGSSGFSTPLGAGSYSIWLQEISPDAGTLPFGFDFVIASVPEPSSWVLMLGGFGLIGFQLRRRLAASRAAAPA